MGRLKETLRRLKCLFLGHDHIRFPSQDDGAIAKQYDAIHRELYRVYLCRSCKSMSWVAGPLVEGGTAEAMVIMDLEALGTAYLVKLKKMASETEEGISEDPETLH